MASAHNRYFNLDDDGRPEPIDVLAPSTYDRGKDYYIDVLRCVEEEGAVSGLTFYLSELPPASLPQIGKDVVLILVSDEAFCARPYFPDLLALIRTYSGQPYYGYGPPRDTASRSALAQYVYKKLQSSSSSLQSALARRDLSIFSQPARTLHTPLGSFFRFRPEVRPMAERSINFAFLGSVEYGNSRRRWQHSLLQPPKLASRAALLRGIDSYAATHGDRGHVLTTGDFEESIKNKEGYIRTLENCRISLCPRGSNPETYRFFESCAAGCVVVCEPLPSSWFYDGHPAIVLSDWRELPELLQSLLADPVHLQKRSDATRAYWQRSLSERAVASKLVSFLQR